MGDIYGRKRDDGKYVIFSPLNNSVSLVNRALLLEYKKYFGSDIPEDKLALFREAGLIVEPIKRRPVTFEPTHLILFLTSDCNLRCVYCYGSAGVVKKTIDLRAAHAGVDLIVENALKRKLPGVSLTLHGGGEPTFAWDVFTEVTGYMRQKASENHLESKIGTVTNGVLTDVQTEYLIKNIDRLQLSMDGPEDIQNKQRPLYKPSPGGSYEAVMATVSRLNKAKFPFNVRATVADEGVHRLEEILMFFVDKVKPGLIHFEPLYECGRCATTGWKSPDPEVFGEEFMKALDVAEREKVVLTTSMGSMNKVSLYFCGAAGSNFCVTAEGFVSSCHEITLKSDPRSDIFFYGRFDFDNGKFEIDEKKRSVLLSREVENMENCRKCFLKLTCSGDCLARSALKGNIFDSDDERCKNQQFIAKRKLDKLLEAKDERKV